MARLQMQKPDRIEQLVAEIIRELGADKEPGALDLERTPARVARALRGELLRGYTESDVDLAKKVTTFSAEGQRTMVVVRGIDFSSMCAHHMLPFMGQATIGYLPGDRIVGLSKLPRIVHHFAARFQTQERLTEQCAEFLYTHVGATFAVVCMEAEHTCMRIRGVKQSRSSTLTQSTRPLPPNEDALAEFQRLVSIRS